MRGLERGRGRQREKDEGSREIDKIEEDAEGTRERRMRILEREG